VTEPEATTTEATTTEATTTEATTTEATAPGPTGKTAVVTGTAQGRKQEVQTVPIAFQLLGPDQIAKVGAVNLAPSAAVTETLPSLRTVSLQAASPVLKSRHTHLETPKSPLAP